MKDALDPVLTNQLGNRRVGKGLAPRTRKHQGRLAAGLGLSQDLTGS